MKLLIDSADLTQIAELYDIFPVDGVTTNPSILARAGRPPFEVLHEIRDFIGKDADLHAQVIAADAEGMIGDAHRILRELGTSTLVKVPAVPQGFKAMKALAAEGVRITATAVYAPMQAVIAARCGAECVAPYVNRIDNMGYDGVSVAAQIQRIFDIQGFDTYVLGASFKNSQQVQLLLDSGVAAVTAAPDVMRGLVKNIAVDKAVADFIADFEKLTGPGTVMADC